MHQMARRQPSPRKKFEKGRFSGLFYSPKKLDKMPSIFNEGSILNPYNRD